MPITPYLKGQPFAPHVVKVMGIAFENACATLKVGPMDHRRVQIARTVIALAQRGITDPDKLAAATIKEVKPK